MIFCGDIALPDTSIGIDIPKELCDKSWFVNLEGSLISSSQVAVIREQNRVFNSIAALKKLSEKLNIKICSLANNHIEDCNFVDNTIQVINNLGLKYVGAGSNLPEAEGALSVPEEKMIILSFGWDVIKCPIATDTRSGVNPYEKNHVIDSVRNVLMTRKRVVCFFHWGYELEAYPLPYDRELAHQLIDMGVTAIIGCHAHRAQQIEFYHGKPIVYGLGNFLFPHRVYWNGRLKFPEFTRRELAFEITIEERLFAHWFDFDIDHNVLRYQYSEELTSRLGDFEGQATYTAMSSKEYDTFFKANRYHKKLLPVFLSHESNLMYAAKSKFVKLRGTVIDLMVKLNLKAKKK